MALGCGSSLDVDGLTTVGGNARLADTTRNALAVLEYLHRDDVPVARGASRPLSRSYPYAYGFGREHAVARPGHGDGVDGTGHGTVLRSVLPHPGSPRVFQFSTLGEYRPRPRVIPNGAKRPACRSIGAGRSEESKEPLSNGPNSVVALLERGFRRFTALSWRCHRGRRPLNWPCRGDSPLRTLILDAVRP